MHRLERKSGTRYIDGDETFRLTVSEQTLSKVESADDPKDEGGTSEEHRSGGHDGKESPCDEGPSEGCREEHYAPSSEIDQGNDEEEEHRKPQFAADANPAKAQPRNQDLMTN